MRVLVVEDDRALSELLRRGLSQEQHNVDLCHDGRDALDRASGSGYDAIVLDLMLPGLDGLEVARRLRHKGNTTPLLMLTALEGLHDRLRGFDAGADDYLTKPFSFEELIARLRAITRRSVPQHEANLLTVGDLVLDRKSHTVTRAGQEIALPPKEFALLECLMRNPGQVLTRTVLLERVWDHGFDSFANVVDVAIRRLRRAVDEGFDRPLIHTVRNVGYMIRA
jgi:two-component system OmpR family response regulator